MYTTAPQTYFKLYKELEGLRVLVGYVVRVLYHSICSVRSETEDQQVHVLQQSEWKLQEIKSSNRGGDIERENA